MIPIMTDPMGRNWRQPDKDNILIDDTHAIMNKPDFDRLAEYSYLQPSGVYVGKMWKMQRGDTWYLCWYGVDPEPGYCSNNYRKILIID